MFFGKKKKNKVDDDDDDFLDEDDEFDFDDIGDFDEFDGNPREPSKKELAGLVGKEALGNTAKKVRQESIKEVIPGDFESNFLDVKDFASHTKDLLTDSVKEITDSVGKLLPKSLADKLGIGKDDERQKQISEAEAREAGIQNSINAIFNKQKSLEEKVEKDKDVQREVAVESSKLAVSKLQTDVMGGMSNDISKLSGFFLDIGNEYFKKTLELQFKSYYLQLDMIKLSTTYFKGFSEQFDKIVKNTALPEHVKITQAERVEGKMRDAIAEKVYATAWSNNQYVQTIKDNLARRIKGFTSDIKGHIGSISSIFEMSDDVGGRSSMIARMIGAALGDKAAEKFMNKFRPHLKEKLGENKTLKQLGYLGENITKNTHGVIARLREKAATRIEETEDEMGLGAKISNRIWKMVNSATELGRMRRRDMSIAERGMDDINEPAIFDNSAYRTITDAIPQYLSRILQQNTFLTSMYRARNIGDSRVKGINEPALLHYNYITRKLNTIDDYRKSVTGFLTRRDSMQGYKTAGRRTMSMIATDIKEAKGEDWKKKHKFFNNGKNLDLLDEYMEAMSNREGIEGDFDKMFTEALSDNAHVDIKEFLRDNPRTAKLIEEINEYTKGEGNESRNIKAKEFLETAKTDVNNDYPLGTIKEVVMNVSKLAGNLEVKNKMNDVEATILGRAIARYQKNPNNVLIANERVLKAVFSAENLVGTKDEGAIEKIASFVNDIADILNSDDKERKEELQYMLGILDAAIRGRTTLGKEGEDYLKERLLKIVNANSELYDGVNEFGVEHMLEGFVGSQEEYKNYINPDDKGFTQDDINKIFDNVEIKATRSAIANSIMLKGVSEKMGGFRKSWEEGKNMIESFSKVFTYIKEEFGKGLETLKTTFDEKSEKWKAKLSEITINMSASAAKKSMETLINYTRDTKEGAKERMEEDIKTFKEGLDNLDEVIRNLVTETDTDEDEIDKIRKRKIELEKDQAKKIAAYETLIKGLEETEKKLMAANPEEYTKEFIKELPGKTKEILGEGLSKLKSLFEVTKKNDV